MSTQRHLRLVQQADAPVGRDDGAAASDPQPEREERPALRTKAFADLGDAVLVDAVVRGETAAAECLYRRHAAFALNLAARLSGSSAEIEDVVHDAFIRAFEHAASLRNPAAFKTWLGSIVVHALRSRLRREKLRRLLGLGPSGAQAVDIEAVASAGASPATKAELAQIYALLRTLPADDRIAWTLRYVEGHELTEAAELAGCSLATVKRRIARVQRFIDAHFVAPGAEREES